ncbi:MAG: L-fucose/L-arabinose isomerase family protein [Proteobacteria bacterium]|nr:L-fucose/L-arabinose isomerase family protein [Pseudomonadota bacterium]
MESRSPKIGVVALARTTFDIPFAEEMASKAWKTLQSLNLETIGDKELLCDGDAVKKAIELLGQQKPDALLIIQVTFTDAVMTVELAKALGIPALIWSFPESREGGRLRLNSLCGSNLAAHALGKAGISFDYLHRQPDSQEALQKIESFARAAMTVNRLSEATLLVIGDHPDGFDTCEYDAAELKQWCGVDVQKTDLMDFLGKVSIAPDQAAEEIHAKVDKEVVNLAEMEKEPLMKSFKVYHSLKQVAAEKEVDGLAVRCWPEFFTELGCAACGPMSMMNEDGIPSACEADLFGSLTSLMLQTLGNSAVFLSDLVDINIEDDTGVFWHCGLAPLSMADPDKEVRAQIHTNRKKPFLYEFTLKPGRVTFVRISQSQNQKKMIVGTGEMISAPMAFTGTSGVIRFDIPAQKVLDFIMKEKLEHHFSLIYGNFKMELQQIASLLDIPYVEVA